MIRFFIKRTFRISFWLKFRYRSGFLVEKLLKFSLVNVMYFFYVWLGLASPFLAPPSPGNPSLSRHHSRVNPCLTSHLFSHCPSLQGVELTASLAHCPVGQAADNGGTGDVLVGEEGGDPVLVSFSILSCSVWVSPGISIVWSRELLRWLKSRVSFDRFMMTISHQLL